MSKVVGESVVIVNSVALGVVAVSCTAVFVALRSAIFRLLPIVMMLLGVGLVFDPQDTLTKCLGKTQFAVTLGSQSMLHVQVLAAVMLGYATSLLSVGSIACSHTKGMNAFVLALSSLSIGYVLRTSTEVSLSADHKSFLQLATTSIGAAALFVAIGSFVGPIVYKRLRGSK